MGTMTVRRRRFGLRPTLHVESLDLEQLITESLIRIHHTHIASLNIEDFDDGPTIRRIGWYMTSRTGTDFRLGRRILKLLSPDGYLLPPPEYRLSLQTEPTEEQMFRAPMVHPWGLELWQTGLLPAEWRLSGTVYHRDWEPRIWCRVLYLNRAYMMALTVDGWVRLGKRMHS